MSLINRMLLDLNARQDERHRNGDNITNNLRPVIPTANSTRYMSTSIVITTSLILLSIGWAYLHTLSNNTETTPTLQTTTAPTHVIIATSKKLNPAALTIKKQTPKDQKHQKIKTKQPESRRNTTVIAPPTTTVTTTRATSKKIIARANDAPSLTIKPTVVLAEASSPAPKPKPEPLIGTETSLPQPILIRTTNQSEFQYATALRYIKQRQMKQGVGLLQRMLQTEPGHLQARETLISLFIEQRRWQEAEQLLASGIALQPHHLNYTHLLARLKIEQGNDMEAISLLEKPLKQGNHHPESSALLAFLYQRQGRHSDASSHYKRALTAQPSRGKWWLGLAISLEAQQDWLTAGKAYRLAAASEKLTPQLQQYARQRQQAIRDRPTLR